MENSGRPAYPLKADFGQGKSMHYFGLSKREYFAGLAMQGILSSGIPWNQKMEAKDVACECLCLADALLKQLEP